MATHIEDMVSGQYIYVRGQTLAKAIQDHIKGSLTPTLQQLLDAVSSALETKDDAIAILVALNTGMGADLNATAMAIKAQLDKINKVSHHIERLSVIVQYVQPETGYRIAVDEASYYGL